MALKIFQITQEYTIAVVKAIEKLIKAPTLKNTKPNDLERLAQVAQKVILFTLIFTLI
ncbi:unnamed protein product [Onchocerca flexuosa]|uniref:Transposase n=1 Tax=Onchocerca flexuosa TaxID=387005 RepID=A0A183I800_9BILA|nr:unnamed protein product [Onchocerca flexuosa]